MRAAHALGRCRCLRFRAGAAGGGLGEGSRVEGGQAESLNRLDGESVDRIDRVKAWVAEQGQASHAKVGVIDVDLVSGAVGNTAIVWVLAREDKVLQLVLNPAGP